jgi:hypothetical protein
VIIALFPFLEFSGDFEYAQPMNNPPTGRKYITHLLESRIPETQSNPNKKIADEIPEKIPIAIHIKPQIAMFLSILQQI